MKTEILAIDVGLARVGIAIGSLEAKISSPLKVVAARQAEAEILNIIKERSISAVVIGLPLNDDNSESPMCAKIRKFSRRLTKRADIKIVFVDEFASSTEAADAVIARGEPTDHIAAAIILKRYFADEGIVR